MLSIVQPCLRRKLVTTLDIVSHSRVVSIASPATHGSPPEPSKSRQKKATKKTEVPTPPITSIPSSVLSYYYDTTPPTKGQLRIADRFFTDHKPELIFSAGEFHQVKITSVPEVAFLGRSNVGKSSLLNALMAQKNLCYTSAHPGKTRTMNGFAVGGPDGLGNPGRLTVLDMPGYGKGSREEWGKEIVKYLVGRKEYTIWFRVPRILADDDRLRRVFLLVDPLHGLKKTDEQILRLFRHNAVPHQVILSKVDRILLPKNSRKYIREARFAKHVTLLQEIVERVRGSIQRKGDGPPALGEILSVSADMDSKWAKLTPKQQGVLGISSVRWAVLAATGFNQHTTDLKVQSMGP